MKEKEDEIYEVKVGDSIFTFGGPCPKLESVFFEQEKKEGENINETSQSPRR